MDALENVREHISRMVLQGELNKELGEDGDAFRVQLRGFRDEARRESARSELERLKKEFLPTPAIPAAVVSKTTTGGGLEASGVPVVG